MTRTSASEQIEAIHSMMSTGHHSVRIETHTLVIWGITAALIILFTADIFNHERFPDLAIRSISMTAFITVILIIAGTLEYRLTRKNREQRDETVSFVQTQLIKVWWLILALLVIINMAMQFFGGGYMLYSLTLSFMGMALYIHGLFSRQMLSWAGVCMIILGLTTLAAKLPLQLIEWITIFCYGVGWPLLAWAINHRGINKNQLHRLLFTLIWLSVILVPAYTVTLMASEAATAPYITLDEYRQLPAAPSGKHIVQLPAGTDIPINYNVQGGILDIPDKPELAFTLAKDIAIEIENGKPTGRFQIADQSWQEFRYNFRIRFTRLLSRLAPDQGPRIDVNMKVINQD